MLFNPRVSTEEGPWSPSSPKARRSVPGWSHSQCQKPSVDRCGSGRHGFHIRRHGPVSGVDGQLRLVRTKTGIRTIRIQKSNKTTSHITDLELEPNPPAIVRETPMCCSDSVARPSTTTQMKIFDTPVATNRIEHSAACEVWELAASPTSTCSPAALPQGFDAHGSRRRRRRRIGAARQSTLGYLPSLPG